MKFTKLLVMSALWLIGSNVNAADLVERVKPTNADVPETPVEFKVGETYLLYNVTAEKYFTQGNTWGTRGCVGPKASAVLIKVAQYKVEDVWDEKTYEIQDYVTPRTGSYSWYKMSMDDAGNIYTDQTTWGNRFYEIQKQAEGTNVYRIMPNEVNALHKSDGTQFLGRDDAVSQDFSNAWNQFTDDSERYPLSALITAEEGHHVDWQFFSCAVFDVYEKSQELKAIIEKAEEAGIDVTDAVNAYNNPDATIEEMDYEIKALEDAIKNNIANATGQHPQDASAWITNGTFDTIGDFTGWSTNNGKFGAGGTTSTNAEVYGKNAFDINQEIVVKYPGLYLFGVKGFYRAGSSDDSYNRVMSDDPEARLSSYYVTIGDQTEELVMSNIFDGAPTVKPAHGKAMASNGFWIPNTMADANEFFHTDGLYGHLLPVEISGSDVNVKIGVKKEKTTDYDAWSIFDDFTLIFCGAGDDRWVGYAKKLAENYPAYGNVTATQKYIDDYTALKNNPTATTKDEADAYVAQLKAAKAALDLNIKLWKTLEDSVAYATTFVQQYVDMDQGSVPAVQVLNSYLTGRNGISKKIEARALTNEQLRQELDKLAQMISDVLNGVEVVPGMDMTDRLINPAFDTDDWTGWTHQAASGGNVRVGSKCCEAWNNASFDIYQEVKKMPIGIYEISVQGFYRYGRNNAWNDYNNNNVPNPTPVSIYMNANTTSFMNVFDPSAAVTEEAFYKNPDTDYASYAGKDAEGGDVTYYFPNGMSSSARAFDDGKYVNSAYGAVVNTEDLMRLGVKGSSNQLGDSWVIFDNFKLTYWAKVAEKVKYALEGAIAEMDQLRTGRVGSNVTAELTNRIEAAKKALNEQAEDGDALFDALVALYDLKSLVKESAALMDDLALRVDSLKGDITLATSADAYANMAYTLADAKALCDNIERGLSEQTISDDDVPALIEQINAQRANAQKCIDLEDGLNKLSDALMGDLDGVSNDWITKASNLYEAVLLKIAQANLQMNEVDGYLKDIQLLISTKFMPVDMDLATDENPVDATAMLQTPAFQKYDAIEETSTNAIDGWKGTDGYNFGNDNHQKEALAVEFYHKAFDMYQDIYGLRPGMYEVRANAFARKDNSTSTDTRIYADAMKDNEVVDVNNVIVKGREAGVIEYGDSLVFFTQEETIDEGTGEAIIKYSANGATIYTVTDPETSKVDTLGWVPNDMVSAATFFHLNTEKYANLYTNSVFVKIEEGQFLRLGMKTEDANTWVLMDDFQLIYYGAQSTKQPSGPSTGIKAVEAAAAADVVRTEYFTLGGMRSLTPQKGINIMRQTLSNGMVVVKKVNLK